MPQYCFIPKEVESAIDEMIKIDVNNLDGELENNIANEAILNHLIYTSTDKEIEYEATLSSLKKKLRANYIKGNIDDNDDFSGIRFTKSEVDTYIECDREVIELTRKIKELSNAITYYERMLQTVRNKNFTMKNIIELKKFQAGM